MILFVLGGLVDSHEVVRKTVAYHLIGVIRIVLTVVFVVVWYVEVILSLLFLLKLAQNVANHILGILHPLFIDLLALLCLLGVFIVELIPIISLWLQ
jgi:hypothetical protein